MHYQALGNTDIHVSAACLGTMTFGGQNNQDEAFAQLDLAIERGINFIDTAEMYAIPTSPNTCGETERILGHWFKHSGKRQQMVLATKVTGPSRIKHIRHGKARLDAINIQAAVEGSLTRLQTDYIDLYQLHWPDRQTNFFGSLSYQYPEKSSQHQAVETPIEDTLYALSKLVDSGKIRAIGISNETAWGAMKFLHVAESLNLPRVVSIQNPYNLLNRSFELNLAEIAHREQLSLLAYSPLAFGTLTGKYRHNARPGKARCTLFREFKRYFTPSANQAVEKYAQLAEQYQLSLSQMALAFVHQQAFVSSVIIGATKLEQLEDNIAALYVQLELELLKEIEKIHTEHTYPAP